MVEMDRLVNSNGIVRGLFKDFLDSEKFRLIIDKMKNEAIPVTEIVYGNHCIVINDYSQSGNSDTSDAQETEALKRGKYFHVRLILNRDSSNSISGHRIVNPIWRVFTEPPENAIYLVASCWIDTKEFYDDLELLETTVQDILENLDPVLLHPYEAIDIPS